MMNGLLQIFVDMLRFPQFLKRSFNMSAVQNIPLTPAETSAQTQVASRPRLLTAVTLVTPLLVAFGLYMALIYAPLEKSQGEIQRIFYIHVAAFSGAFIAFCATVIGGVMYLRSRKVKWDTLALAGVEVGMALALINLVTGMVWERPIWNTWWTWDPRLTMEIIMLLTYAAYIMLRNGIESPERRRRFASVYGILAMTTVIINFLIIRVRPDTIHPTVIGPSVQNPTGQFEMTPPMVTALAINSTIWSIFVPLTLLWWRIRLENLGERVNALKMKLVN
jgi:heme exporter protein C